MGTSAINTAWVHWKRQRNKRKKIVHKINDEVMLQQVNSTRFSDHRGIFSSPITGFYDPEQKDRVHIHYPRPSSLHLSCYLLLYALLSSKVFTTQQRKNS